MERDHSAQWAKGYEQPCPMLGMWAQGVVSRGVLGTIPEWLGELCGCATCLGVICWKTNV